MTGPGLEPLGEGNEPPSRASVRQVVLRAGPRTIRCATKAARTRGLSPLRRPPRRNRSACRPLAHWGSSLHRASERRTTVHPRCAARNARAPAGPRPGRVVDEDERLVGKQRLDDAEREVVGTRRVLTVVEVDPDRTVHRAPDPGVRTRPPRPAGRPVGRSAVRGCRRPRPGALVAVTPLGEVLDGDDRSCPRIPCRHCRWTCLKSCRTSTQHFRRQGGARRARSRIADPSGGW